MMVKRIALSVAAFLLLVTVSTALAAEAEQYVCGLSDGYPPYQFRNARGESTGFDADVLRLVFQKIKKKLVFRQTNWDDVVGLLAFTDKLDCVAGMEINDTRKEFFGFTSPYYYRKIVIFVLSDNADISTLEDLAGQKITGDRHSSIEALMEKKGLRNKIRIKSTQSKEESMRLMKTGEFVAMIAPKAVGFYLAEQFNVNVRILVETDQGSPVGIAVKKGNTQLLKLLETALQELVLAGEIDNMYQAWGYGSKPSGG